MVLWPCTAKGEKDLLVASLALLEASLDLWAPEQVASRWAVLGLESLAAGVGKVQHWETASLVGELCQEGKDDLVDSIVCADLVDVDVACVAAV